MKTLRITNNDLVFSDGNLEMVEGNEEVMQSTERILTTNKKEFFLNIILGLDYNAIQGRGKSEESIRFAILEAINQDERINDIEIMEISVDRKLRELKVDFQYATEEGTIVGEEVLLFG